MRAPHPERMACGPCVLGDSSYTAATHNTRTVRNRAGRHLKQCALILSGMIIHILAPAMWKHSRVYKPTAVVHAPLLLAVTVLGP